MAHDREVAGLRCFQVLEKLSEYLDHDLSADETARIDRHLQGCDWCERFGGQMSDVVRALRERLGSPDPVDPDVAERLRRRLDEEPTSEK